MHSWDIFPSLVSQEPNSVSILQDQLIDGIPCTEAIRGYDLILQLDSGKAVYEKCRQHIFSYFSFPRRKTIDTFDALLYK